MEETSKNIIELKNVGISFGSLTIHKDISFQIKQGETVTILGPSGIGKTLILKMIIGLLPASSGSVTVFGRNLLNLTERKLRVVRQRIGMLFQGAALFDSLTVFDNIAYPLRERGSQDESEIKKIVHESLEIVDLPGIGHKKPAELSGGQKKRIGLARALASSPEVVLFDEPTTGLDPTATRLINELIIKLRDEFGMTCIVVTHDIESAKQISDRWLLVNNGIIAADGPVQEVMRENTDIQEFITGNWESELHVLG